MRPTRREFLKRAGAGISLGALSSRGSMDSMRKPEKPNFIVFLTDDHGYGDLSCMGAADLRTPHLDCLAASGVRFTDWYANAPLCSPSRASLLTGRYPARAGVRGNVPCLRTQPGLPSETPTLATALRRLGYRTAMFGKWHLGAAPGSRPDDHGFEDWFGILSGCVDYYSHIFYWDKSEDATPFHDLWQNGEEIHENGRYLTELITERAVRYVRRAARRGDPFFIYVAYTSPHYPMHAPQEYLERFRRLSWDRRVMAAMLAVVDDGVGAILAELDKRRLRENTCIFFQSDNGPSREVRNWLDGAREPYYGGSAGPLKGHKFSLYEGGIRVPALMSWPGRIPRGKVVHGVGVAMDIFPTFLKAAGGNPDEYDLDGLDVMDMVTEGAAGPHDLVFWETGNQTAVRRGPWKLVLNGQLVEGAARPDSVHLANLDTDIGEEQNVKSRYPELTAELKSAVDAWRARIEGEWQQQAARRLSG